MCQLPVTTSLEDKTDQPDECAEKSKDTKAIVSKLHGYQRCDNDPHDEALKQEHFEEADPPSTFPLFPAPGSVAEIFSVAKVA